MLRGQILFLPFPSLPKPAVFKYCDTVTCYLKRIPQGNGLVYLLVTEEESSWLILRSLAHLPVLTENTFNRVMLAGGSGHGNWDP